VPHAQSSAQALQLRRDASTGTAAYACGMTRFGPCSTALAIGAAFGLAVALLLAFTRSNAVANRLLALLLLVFVLKLMPYALGFAGCYAAVQAYLC
jgi:NhaP-type Na+/H+ or K+/H+ antiporter